MKKKRIHIFVSGRVQKVFYRGTAEIKARKYKLTGWVRNLEDGRVELVAEGKERALKKLLKWSEKGSDAALVKKVDFEWDEYTGEFDDFNIC